MQLNIMSEVTEEIDKAIMSLGLAGKVQRLPATEEIQLYKMLVSEFVEGHDRHWWWEGFTKPSASISFTDGMGFKRLSCLAPAECCWFVVEDTESDVYPIFEATPEFAASIIGECFAFEYYLVAKDMRWLVCENHHGVVVGIGAEVIGAINRAAAA